MNIVSKSSSFMFLKEEKLFLYVQTWAKMLHSLIDFFLFIEFTDMQMKIESADCRIDVNWFVVMNQIRSAVPWDLFKLILLTSCFHINDGIKNNFLIKIRDVFYKNSTNRFRNDFCTSQRLVVIPVKYRRCNDGIQGLKQYWCKSDATPDEWAALIITVYPRARSPTAAIQCLQDS